MPDEKIIAEGLELLRKGTADIPTSTCPCCGSNEIDAIDHDGADMLVEKCECNNCGCVWELTYEICGIEILEDGDPEATEDDAEPDEPEHIRYTGRPEPHAAGDQ